MASRVLDACGLTRVQSWDLRQAPPSQAEEAVGVAWPNATGAVASGRADILCIGPTEWLVSAADSQAGSLLQALSDAFQGSTFRATDVSSALTRMEVEGAHARALLAKGCALDFHPQAFPPQRCARTRFAGMPMVIRCTQASRFECIVSLSCRDYVMSWLADAAAEFATR